MAVIRSQLSVLLRFLGTRDSVATTSSVTQCRAYRCTPRKLATENGAVESPSASLRRAFQSLGLEQDECSIEEIRTAYIRLAKKYHPDSSSGEADANRFSEMREAYKKCMSYTKNVSMTRDIYAALEQELADLDRRLGYSAARQPRLAHRHYLSYDVGVGNVAQRQRAHSQQRVNEAMDSVFDKQFQKALENPDVKEIAPYEKGRKVPGGKTTESIQRIANEIIYDSMKRGEFENLKGQGKPLKLDPINPVLDNIEQKINKMLSNSGFAPEWITLDKEIRTAVDKLKSDMETAWNKHGPHPMRQEQLMHWEQCLSEFQDSVNTINRKIFNLNLIVPSLTSQRTHLKLERLLSKEMERAPIPPEPAAVLHTSTDPSGASGGDQLGELYLRLLDGAKQLYSSWAHRWK